MRARHVSIVLLMLILVGGSARAQFEGSLELVPKGCELQGECKLKHPLRFTDSSSTVWEARAGLPTDGASIPEVFQPLIGAPFDPAFIKAAVIHDHYCDRQVRPWTQTHRVFYEGLLAQGVSRAKAKTMYFAVYLGGPKWVKLEPGKTCGRNCVNNFKSLSGVAGVYSRRADYSAPDVAPSTQAIAKLLELSPEALSLDELEALARKLRPLDFFYRNGHSIEASQLGITE